MAQNISLMGASYSDVPAVQLPKTGGGTALFADPSGVTAAAADVASGKYFIDSNGNLVTGTASGGGGNPGWTLLASGTHTQTTSTSTMKISVSYTGTAKWFYVVAANGRTNGGTWGWLGVFENGLVNGIPQFWASRYGTNTTGTGSSNQLSLTSTQISCPRVNSSNQVLAQDYKWYIYGEAST